MGEKREIKVRLCTVISMFIIFILIIALGVTYYFGFVNNNEEEQKIENEVSSIEKIEKDDNTKNVKEDEDNIVQENETVTVNERDKAIEKIKKALTSEKWIKENLYMVKNFFDEEISENTEQLITFEVVNNGKEKAPIIVVQTETNLDTDNSKQLSFIEYKNDKVKVETWNTGNSSRIGYNIKDNILISSWAAMGDWSYSVFKIDESSGETIERDEGSMGDEDDGYVELEKVIEKYSAKPISKELNDSNIEKYIK